MKRILSLVCALALALSMVPLTASASGPASKEDIEKAVSSQIRSFADSLKQSDAVDNAAKALAKHGLTQKGKKLTAGKSHALTATLWSTEMLQDVLVRSCSELLWLMQLTDPTKTMYIRSSPAWYDGSGSNYSASRCSSPGYEAEYCDLPLVRQIPYTGPKNSYDNAMVWMAGATDLRVEVAWVRTTASAMEYKVTCRVIDRFDFTTSGNGAFKNLISGLGAALFREFDWESTVTFNLSVPYSCSHTLDASGWVYSKENHTFTSLAGDGLTENPVTTLTTKMDNGNTYYYYRLSDGAELRHDRPWVLEYDTRSPSVTLLAPHSQLTTAELALWLSYQNHISLLSRKRIDVSQEMMDRYGLETYIQYESSYYGANVKGMFPFSGSKLYTFRLENQVNPDGSNMIYLSILERDTGAVMVDRVAMDTVCMVQSWTGVNVNYGSELEWKDAGGWVSGKDLYINYIGNRSQPLFENHFDLRIWENGKDAPSGSSCTEKVTRPSCTEKGYTTYSCFSCGYVWEGSYTDPAGHRWSEWASVTPALERRACTGCGETEERTVLRPGDCTGDGEVNALDLVRLRQYLAGWDVQLPSGDCTGDGRVDALDLIRLRQYLAGWDVKLGS